ncbi:MAG: hypothetical protein ACKO2P_14935 [Planctomycetota bacterium]
MSVDKDDKLRGRHAGALLLNAAGVRLPRRSLRRRFGSLGISTAVHAAVLFCFSMIALAQREIPVILVSEIRFAEPERDPDDFTDIPALVLPLASFQTPRSSAATSLPSPETVTGPPLPDIDLSAFGSVPAGNMPPEITVQAASDAESTVASGIQKRVEQAGGRRGVVQFSLAWQSLNDVDLHVIAPSGEHISYHRRTSQCRGKLDVDMNAKALEDPEDESVSTEPVENVRWLDRNAPAGRYTVLIHLYRWNHQHTAEPFQLLANLGEQTQVMSDNVSQSRRIAVHRFLYVPSSVAEGYRVQMLSQLSRLQEREEQTASGLLERATRMSPGLRRDQAMMTIINRFPHTDASVQALQELPSTQSKN